MTVSGSVRYDVVDDDDADGGDDAGYAWWSLWWKMWNNSNGQDIHSAMTWCTIASLWCTSDVHQMEWEERKGNWRYEIGTHSRSSRIVKENIKIKVTQKRWKYISIKLTRNVMCSYECLHINILSKRWKCFCHLMSYPEGLIYWSSPKTRLFSSIWQPILFTTYLNIKLYCCSRLHIVGNM